MYFTSPKYVEFFVTSPQSKEKAEVVFAKHFIRMYVFILISEIYVKL